MDGTQKGGARERNPVGGEFDPICQRNLSSAAMPAIGPKRENEEDDANQWVNINEGLVRTQTKMYSKTPEQLCETKQKKRGQQKEKRAAFEMSLTPDELECNAEKKGRRIVQGICTFLPCQRVQSNVRKGNENRKLGSHKSLACQRVHSYMRTGHFNSKLGSRKSLACQRVHPNVRIGHFNSKLGSRKSLV